MYDGQWVTCKHGSASKGGVGLPYNAADVAK